MTGHRWLILLVLSAIAACQSDSPDPAAEPDANSSEDVSVHDVAADMGPDLGSDASDTSTDLTIPDDPLPGFAAEEWIDGEAPCATPEELAEIGGTLLYEGDADGADPEGQFDIWVTGAPDWTRTHLVQDEGFQGHPSWSPDRTRFVFDVNALDGPDVDLHVMNIDGSGREVLVDTDTVEAYAKWTEDGIIYAVDWEYFVVDPQTKVVAPYPVVDLGPDVRDRTISPDGTRVAYVVEAASGTIYHLYVADADGSNATRVVHGCLRGLHPRWSSSGQYLSYSCGDGSRDGWDVRVIDAITLEGKTITTNPNADWASGWAADDEWLLINSDVGGNWDVYAFRADGSERLRMTCHTAHARFGEWVPEEVLR